MKKIMLIVSNFIFFLLIFYINSSFAATSELKVTSTSQYTILNSQNETFIAGNLNIVQVVNNKNYNLTHLPFLYLKSDDNTFSQKCFIVDEGNGNYYYDTPVQNIDISKIYYLEILYDNTSFKVNLTNDSFLKNDLFIEYKNNKIIFSTLFSCNINATSTTQYTILNNNNDIFIAGNIYIVQTIDNKKYYLTQKPKLYLKSNDGSYSQECFLVNQGNGNYYFDTPITQLETSKIYYLEIIYNENTTKVTLNNDTFLKTNFIIQYKNNDITISTKKLNATSKTQYTVLNSNNEVFIAGDLHIIQTLGDITYNLDYLPALYLKSEDNLYSQKCFIVSQGNGSYYFDAPVHYLDTSKIYYLEISYDKHLSKIKLTNDNFFKNNLLIQYKNNNIIISNTYESTIKASSKTQYTVSNKNNDAYIVGDLNIFQIIGDKEYNLAETPNLYLKSDDKMFSQKCFIVSQGNNQYYFDTIIENLDTSKTYYLEIVFNNNYYTVNLNNQTFMENNIFIVYSNNKITFSKNYYADTKGIIYNASIIKNIENENYIVGNLELTQNIEKNNFSVASTPKITLKSTDGSYKQTAWINKINATNYYFDINIEQINLNKTYYIEVDSNNSYNISSKKIIILNINSLPSSIESKYTTSITNDCIFFLKKYTYLSSSTYGQSGLKIIGDSRGTDLKYYKIGHGENVLFATFALHGYEDLWSADGKELTIIAEDFAKKLAISNDIYIANNWTIYIFPQCNPDGVNYGYTNNGPGRCTLTGINGYGVDMNRCWSSEFVASYTPRNYTGSLPFEAYEAVYLRDFMLKNKSKYGQTIVIDLHGWTTQLIGDREICLNYYGPQFYDSYNTSLSKYTSNYGNGYLINWAKKNLNNLNGVPARSALIELPSKEILNHNSVLNAGYSQKYYNATVNMLKGIL